MAYTYGAVTNCKVRNGQTRKEYECRLGYEVQSQSIENNTSTIKLRLECRSINSVYETKGSNGLTSIIDGTTIKSNAAVDMSNTNVWQNFGEKTITVTHNEDGTYSVSKSGSFTCTAGSSEYSLKSGSASVTVEPATIPRYANFTQHYISGTGLNSIEVTWAADADCDGVCYSVNGGDWIGTGGTTYTISGLAPNTSYSIRTTIKRVNSQLWKESETLVATTKNIGTITSAPDINFGDTARITKTNPSGVRNRLRIEWIDNGETLVTRDNIGDDYTVTFNDAEWDEFYKRLGSNNSLAIRYVIDTFGDTPYFHWVDRTLTLTGNKKTAHIGVSGVQKRANVFVGINGSVKRAVMWIGNNGRKRCI